MEHQREASFSMAFVGLVVAATLMLSGCATPGAETVQEMDSAEIQAHPIEVSIMAVGSLEGGKLIAGEKGCAVIHFKNLSREDIYFPVGPRSLGKGRVSAWMSDSYSNPKQGEDYGWGYTAAYDFPVVAIEFVAPDGHIALRDDTIQLSDAEYIEAGSIIVCPMLFRAPPEPGVYTMRVTFDNTVYEQPSGYNSASRREMDAYMGKDVPRAVYVSETITLDDIVVVAQ